MIKKLNYFISALLLLSVVYFLLQVSKNPVFLWYSTAKVLVIVASFSAAVFFYWSATRRKVSEWNFLAILCGVSVLAALEISLRLLITHLPPQIVNALPYEAKAIHAARVGNFNETTLRGDGMLYYYPPGFKIDSRPDLKIDSFGYRNPTDLQPNSRIDIVLLGDSVTLARGSDKDLGALFREEGLTAFNFAMGGYSAAHYPLTLQKIIIDRHVKFRRLIIGVCLVNDIPNTQTYYSAEKGGRNYEVYLGRSARPSTQISAWSIALLKSGLFYLKDVYWDRPEIARTANAKGVRFQPPWKTSKDDLGQIAFDVWREDNPTWHLFIEALQQTSQLALDNGAEQVVFALMPGSVEIYQDYIHSEKNDKSEYIAESQEQIRRITETLSTKNVVVIDMTQPLRQAAKTKSVSVDNDFDYHLNSFGVQAIMMP